MSCATSLGPCLLQVLLLWWRVQYFARAFQNTRNTFLNTLVAVTRSVWPFLILLLLTLWGFAGEILKCILKTLNTLPPRGSDGNCTSWVDGCIFD